MGKVVEEGRVKEDEKGEGEGKGKKNIVGGGN